MATQHHRSPLDTVFDGVQQKVPEGFREDFEASGGDHPWPGGLTLPRIPPGEVPNGRYPRFPDGTQDVAEIPPVDSPRVPDENIELPPFEPVELPHPSDHLPPLVDVPEDFGPWEDDKAGVGGGTGRPGPFRLPPTRNWAYYIPRHNSRRRWGIYVRESGIDIVAGYLSAQVKRLGSASPLSPNPAELARWAAYFLYRHESFHFVTELYALQAEDATNRPLYSRYDAWVYSTQLGGARCVEEVLANHAAVGAGQIWSTYRGGGSAGKIRVADLFLPITLLQPPGYRDVQRLLNGSYHWTVAGTRDVLANHIVSSSPAPVPTGGSGALIAHPGVITASGSYRNVPGYLDCDRGGRYIGLLRGRRVRPINFRLRSA